MKHTGKLLFIFILIIAFPLLAMTTPEERAVDNLNIDLSAGPCDTHSSTLIYNWEWSKMPDRFRFWGKETINISFEGINNNNAPCITELDEENSTCTIAYYDKDGNFAANETYSLSDESLTFPSNKWIDGKRCRAQRGTLTVSVCEFIEVDKLYVTLYNVHHTYDNAMISKIVLCHEWVSVYANGQIEGQYE